MQGARHDGQQENTQKRGCGAQQGQQRKGEEGALGKGRGWEGKVVCRRLPSIKGNDDKRNDDGEGRRTADRAHKWNTPITAARTTTFRMRQMT